MSGFSMLSDPPTRENFLALAFVDVLKVITPCFETHATSRFEV